ncbi:LPD38 domain-containing protein [Vreelandella aquamarina]|uniref:LPD38 domain-containing protein n=1 Tax=Vreelandella aquamarina TaxID=77097 RepID=UPI003850C86E
MALLDEIRQKNPSLSNRSDEELKAVIRQSPEFKYFNDEEFDAFVTGGNAQANQQESSPGFMAGVSAGVDQLQAMGGGLLMAAGEALESPGMLEAGRDIYSHNMEEAAENDLGYGFTDIRSVGDAWNWARYTAGNQLPMLAASIVGGGVGGAAVGLTARTLAGATAKEGAKRAGQALGAIGTSTGMETGALMGETEDLDVSLAHGVLAGSLDAVTPLRLLRAAGKSDIADQAASEISDRVLADLQRKAARTTRSAAGRGSLTNLMAEASTEGLQGLINQHANYWVENNGETLLANLGDVDIKALVDEAAAGGLMGGVVGAPAGVLERNQARTQVDRVTQAREQTAAQGGDALDQATAGLGAEQQAQGEQQTTEQSPEVRAQRQQQASEVGLRIQRGLQDADDLQALARGASFEGSTRLRNMDSIIKRAEAALEAGEIERAGRIMERAENIANDLRSALRTAGTRERPMEGELTDPEQPQPIAGLLRGRQGQLPPGTGDSIRGESPQQFDARQRTQQEQADTLNRRSIGRDDVIYGEGPTRDVEAEEQARRAAFERQYGTARNTGLDGEYLGPDPLPGRPNRQGETLDGEIFRRPERLRQDTAPRLPQSGIIYGDGPTAGNANTGLDQPFERARFTDTGARNAMEGQRTQQQASAERAAQLARTRGRGQTTYLPDNTPIRTRFRVVEASELTASNSPDGRVNQRYPQELQPRDRTNANSQVQVRNIAARLNPERLGNSNDAGTGAPIIGSDGVVESGNGRTMAITTAYSQNSPQAQRYREFVRAEAERQGIDPGAVDEMQQPVLVRERITNVDRADFARRANESTVAGMNAYEQAQADADSLTAADLQAWAPDESGDPLAASNRSFQRGFVQRLGNNEASRYTTRDGQATPELGQRMQRAVFAAAYQDPDMVEMVTEQAENMRNLAAGLQAAAADLAVARETGSREALDAIGTINDAVRLVRRSRQEGISVRELARQTDAFSDPVPETTALLAIAINNNMRSRQAMTTAFGYIGRAVRNRAEGEANGALFADDTTNQDIFDAGFQGQNQNQRTQQRPPERDVQPGAQRREQGAERQGQAEPTQRPQAEPTQEVDDEPLLNTYSEQELAEREQAQQQAEEAEASQQREQAQRAQADREADDFVLSGSNRPADIAVSRGQSDLLGSRMESTPPSFTRSSMSNFPDAIIQAGLGVERESDNYQLAKAGDVEAAQRYVEQVVNSDAVQAIYNQLQGRSPIVTPVRAQEEAGRNKIPSAYASLLSEALDLPLDNSIVQANRPQRTSKDGLGRLFAQPIFEGEVQRGRDYLIVDDTLTQGGTFAALKGYIEQNGGNVILASALTGKQYSAKLSPEPALLADVRTKFGDIETDFTETLGYGYDQLTQSEARYISRLTTKAEEFRDFVTQGRDADRREAPISPIREQPQGEPTESNAASLTPNASDNPSTPQNTSFKRRNQPLEYTGYSGEQRSVRSYQEVGNFRIAKVNDSLYEVINPDGQAISQRTGPNGAAEEAARLNSLPADDQRYAIGQSDARPVSREAIEEALADIPEFEGAKVIKSASELPWQSLVIMNMQGVDPQRVRGLFVGDDMYVIADNVDSVEQAISTAVHEAVGHKGMRAVLGKDLDSVMLSLYRNLPNSKEGREALREVEELYPFLDKSDRQDRIRIAEEMVAHLLEKGHRPKAWQRAVAKIRELLRRLFPSVAWTYTDALALGERSRDYLRKRQAENLGSDDQLYALRAKQRVNFEDAFEDFTDKDRKAASKHGDRTPRRRLLEWYKEKTDRAMLKIRQGMVDRYAALKEMDEKLYGADFTEGDDIRRSGWVLARMSNAANGALHTLLHNSRIQLDENERIITPKEDGSQGLGAVLGELGEPAEIQRFMGWIAGNRADKLRQQGRENLFDMDDIDAMKTWNRGQTKDGRNRAELYAKVFAEFQQYRDDVLAIAEQSGILGKGMTERDAFNAALNEFNISKPLRERLKRQQKAVESAKTPEAKQQAEERVAATTQEIRDLMAKRKGSQLSDFDKYVESLQKSQRELWSEEFYVPFYRLSEEKGAPSGQMATSGLSRQQAYKRLKGGTQNLNDLLQNTMMNFHHLLDASLKNQAATQAIENAKELGMAERVPESNRNTKTSTFILEDGQKVFYEIDDPLVFTALTSLSHAGMNSTMMRIMRSFKRIFTNSVTITPQFVAANLIRDSIQATATNEVSKNALSNVLTGWKSFRDAKTHAQMMASGGAFNFGHLYGNNPDELRAQMTRSMRNAKVIGSAGSGWGSIATPVDAVRFLWNWWGDINNTAENANRAAIFTQNQEKGGLKAAFESRDLIDFSAHGAWPAVRILIDIVPFLNARIQGLDKIYRSGMKPGTNVLRELFGGKKASVTDKQAAGRFWAVTGAVTMAALALYLHNYDDERYEALEEWEKDTYWHIFAGSAHMVIPKPFEVGALATLAERFTEQFVNDEATGKLFAQRMGHMMTDTFSFSPVPQMLQPALDIYANKDSFTGRPIESMGMDRLSPEMRKRYSTSKLGTGLSQLLNSTIGAIGDPDSNPAALSPVQVDHLIEGYLGALGTWMLGGTDTVTRLLQGEDAPSTRWYEYQPMRRFYSNLNDVDPYTRYGTVFYEGLREAGRAYSDVKELRELGRLAEAAERAESKREMLQLRPALNRAQRRLSTLNQRIEIIQRSNLDGEIKRQRIDRLQAMKVQIQRMQAERILDARANN